MGWTQHGRIFDPAIEHPALATHAANPVVFPLNDKILRVFFSGRDVQNRSSVGYFDFDIDGGQIVGCCREPLLTPGPPDSFFSHGISLGNWYEAAGQTYLSFMGWHFPTVGHWRGEIGAVPITPDGTVGGEPFKLLGVDEVDPLSVSYPCITKIDHDEYRLWYGSTSQWERPDKDMDHELKCAVSPDARSWRKLGPVTTTGGAWPTTVSRPSVLATTDGYEMFFSYRTDGSPYRIGCARSRDAVEWVLAPEGGPERCANGWDSEMAEYAYAFAHQGVTHLLYNGNDFGRTGIGWATRTP